MMSALTRKLDEVKRLLELYQLYKDSHDEWRRRKAHVDLDRFLMENRETAIMCMEQVLGDELQALIAEQREPKSKKLGLLSKLRLWRRNPAPPKSTEEVMKS